MRIDAFASQEHYASHLRPIFDALDPDERGVFYSPDDTPNVPGNGRDPVMVCAYGDYQRVRHRPVIYCEHGVGQCYPDDNEAYAGGHDRAAVVLFLNPNDHTTEVNAAAHPETPGVTVGTPWLDAQPERVRDGKTVVMSWHWMNRRWGASMSAFDHHRPGLHQSISDLRADGYEVVGTAHPRAWRKPPNVLPWYQAWGVPMVENLRDALDQADVFCADNTSALFYAAALGCRTVAMDCPDYMDGYRYGLWPRFAIDLGEYAAHADLIDSSVEHSVVPDVTDVVPYTSGSAARAVAAIREHVLT